MQNTVDKILKEKIIVIVRGVERDALIPLAEALFEGGIRLLECTFDAKGETPDSETADTSQDSNTASDSETSGASDQ